MDSAAVAKVCTELALEADRSYMLGTFSDGKASPSPAEALYDEGGAALTE
jgi:hypothetical protein